MKLQQDVHSIWRREKTVAGGGGAFFIDKATAKWSNGHLVKLVG